MPFVQPRIDLIMAVRSLMRRGFAANKCWPENLPMNGEAPISHLIGGRRVLCLREISVVAEVDYGANPSQGLRAISRIPYLAG